MTKRFALAVILVAATSAPARADIVPDVPAPGCLWRIDGLDAFPNRVFFSYPQEDQRVRHLVPGELHDPGKGEELPLLHAAPKANAPKDGASIVSLSSFGDLPFAEPSCLAVDPWSEGRDPRVRFVARHYRVDGVDERIRLTHLGDLAVAEDGKTVLGPYEPPAKPARDPREEPDGTSPWIYLGVALLALALVIGGLIRRRG